MNVRSVFLAPILCALASPAWGDLPTEILADSPAGYWRLDELSGTVAVDSSGNNRNLEYQNFGAAGTIGASGAVGNAVQLTRAGADPGLNNAAIHPQVASSDPNQLGFAGSFSVEYLFKAEAGNDSTNGAGITGKGYDSEQATPWYLSRYQNGTADFFVRNASNVSNVVSGTAGITDGFWHHVVGTYDAGAGTINVYIDGVLNASGSGVPADAYGTNTRPFAIGNHFNRGLAATIDEVAVYGSALSAGRVADHFNAARLVTSTAPPSGGSRVLAIDFGNSIGAGGGPGGTQAGYEAFEDTESAGTAPRTASFASAAGGGGDVDVTLRGFEFFRDYRAHSASYGQDELLSDMVLRNSDGTMTVEIADLVTGEYVLRSYHTSSQFGGGTFDLAVNDADGAGSFTLAGLATASDGQLQLVDLPITADGNNPITVDFTGGAGSQHLSLNGFELYLVPEPSSGALLLAGTLLVALRRRR